MPMHVCTAYKSIASSAVRAMAWATRAGEWLRVLGGDNFEYWKSALTDEWRDSRLKGPF